MVMHLLLFLSSLGYIGIALGLMVEVIPSEIVLAYGGFLVAEGTISFIGAVIAGTIGGIIAQLFLYWLGRFGGRPMVEKYGKYIFIQKKQLDVSEQWFIKYGSMVIFFARFIPVVRHAISIPAGISKMSLKKFTGYTLFAVIPWSMLFLYLGMILKSNWKDINTIAAPYVHPAMFIAVFVLAFYFVISLFKKKKKNSALQ